MRPLCGPLKKEDAHGFLKGGWGVNLLQRWKIQTFKVSCLTGACKKKMFRLHYKFDCYKIKNSLDSWLKITQRWPWSLLIHFDLITLAAPSLNTEPFFWTHGILQGNWSFSYYLAHGHRTWMKSKRKVKKKKKKTTLDAHQPTRWEILCMWTATVHCEVL